MRNIEANSDSRRRLGVAFLGLIAFAVLAWLLRATYVVSCTLALALVLTVLVQPVFSALARRLPSWLKWVALVAVLGILLAGIGVLGGMIYLAVNLAADRFPELFERLGREFAALADYLRDLSLPGLNGGVQLGEHAGQVVGLATDVVQRVWTIGAMLVLALFLTLLMLLEVEHWRHKVEALTDGESGSLLDTALKIGRRVRQYLLARTVVSAVSGTAGALWLWVMGLEFAYLWGVIIFVLNFLPYIGSIISTILPSLLAYFSFGLGRGLLTIGGLTGIEQLINNLLEPRLEGRLVRVSPVVLFVSVMFWGWVWGALGAVLAVPLTVSLLLIGEQVPGLERMARMLGQEDEGGHGKPGV
jgi:AI-2 transport protein TqsA